MNTITFVTSNDNKAREAEQILGVSLARHSLELDEIQSMDLAEVVEHKVRQAYSILKKPVLVEDVGFYIKQWNGFPGPLVKWLQETMGYTKLTKLLDKKNRQVEWQVMYGFFDGKKVQIFKGSGLGTIADKPRGTKGWGFDTILIPKGSAKTYAQMGSDERIKVSARMLALRKLRRMISL